jgi:hypothetical protein
VSLSPAELAYAAALIDSFGTLTVREVNGALLPQVIIQGKIAALPWLAEITGVKIIEIRKGYTRHQCTEHCPEAHTRIESITGRWALTGARATVVLFNVEPYLRVQGRIARDLVEAGQGIGYKTQVVNDMKRLGWQLPDLRVQPRARLELAQ